MTEQLSITFGQALSARERVMRLVQGQPWKYREDFPAWLAENLAIWERFEREANTVYERGRRHYSARTIGEFIRHETALRATNDEPWKVNDWRWPDLARLWLTVYPEREGFFELRESPQRRVA